MVRTLALETSGRQGSIALAEDDHVLAERPFAYGLQNAAKILPLIDQLCREHHWAAHDIRRIAISIGPGSFTGLRIGVTLAKSLAFATGAQVVPVQSVDVLAANAPAQANDVIIVLDAKRGQIFTARLHRDPSGQHHNWSHVEPPHLDSLAAMLGRSPRPVHLIGDGIPFHAAAIPNDSGIITTPTDCWTAHAATVARLAVVAQPIANPDDLIPLYIRKPEAEEKADAISEQSRTTRPSAS